MHHDYAMVIATFKKNLSRGEGTEIEREAATKRLWELIASAWAFSGTEHELIEDSLEVVSGEQTARPGIWVGANAVATQLDLTKVSIQRAWDELVRVHKAARAETKEEIEWFAAAMVSCLADRWTPESTDYPPFVALEMVVAGMGT